MWKKILRFESVSHQILRGRDSGDKSAAPPPYTSLSPPYDWIFRGSVSSGEMPPLLRPDETSARLMASPTHQADVQTKLKCVLVGDGAVGKTSLVVSYTTNGYPTEYVPTAFDNYNVVVTVDNQPIRIQLCDTAGQDDFDSLRPLCYPGCDVFIVCFSVVSPTSFYNVRDKWIPELRQHSPTVPILLIGTQSDLRTDVKVLIDLAKYREQPITEEIARKMAQHIGALAYVECSALTQKNLKEVFDQAIMVALEGPPLARGGSSRHGSKKKSSVSSLVATQDQMIDYSDEGRRKRGWRKMCCFS